ncbi:MAG: PEP-CTERM/exosortase system-associated acyltransferase [Hyphomicrobiales bacterium]|nr:PEP-CTERM/exosortase system-associated acyltransferase [Hyphomicrobiales bacterium]MCP5371698.1 PEP-CTERM/exosortase system-associated acyltransferase [Hyphomicrobiales bacterium]
MKRIVAPSDVLQAATRVEPVIVPLDRHAYTGLDGETSPHDVIVATTSQERMLAYRLRYRVLVEELCHQSPEDQPAGMETDAFDGYAEQALLVHRDSGRVSGTVRLILPHPSLAPGSFPSQTLCPDPRLSDPDFLPLARTAEVSRFILAPDARGGGFSSGDTDEDRQRSRIRVYNLTVGLAKAVIRMSVENQVHHLVAIMAPSLLRLLGRLGIHFHPVGPAVQYNGLRQPCHASVRDILERAAAERPDVWEVISANGDYWDIYRDYAGAD